MYLIIGGYAQGKLRYVKNKYSSEAVILNHFHEWVKECLLQGECPEEKLQQFLECNPDCIIISDEIGNGIVPASAFEREYRERVGRMLIELAERAEGVERVICGIGQKIK